MSLSHHQSVCFQTMAGLVFLAILSGGRHHPTQAQTSPDAVTPDQAARPAFSFRLPDKSLSKARQFMNTIALKVLLLLDYVEEDNMEQGIREGPWKTPSLAGIEAARYFVKRLKEGGCRTLELAVSAFPEGGYELYVYGLEVQPGGSQPNPDLPEVQKSIQSLEEAVRTEQQALGLQNLGYEIYQLGYIGSDRALAVLKTLGYTVIEYTQKEGETLYDRIYTPDPEEKWQLPAVIKLIDAPKTSLMDPPPAGSPAKEAPSKKEGMSTVPDIGGTFLHQATTGEPQQNFLIAYDKDNPESLEVLLNLLRDKIDRPARQIVIEALVIEINTDRMKELGLSFHAEPDRGQYDVSSLEIEEETGITLPFTFSFSDRGPKAVSSFQSTLQALLKSGDAEVLSNPSVLVLDGRQARIQVGQQIPVVRSTITAAGITAAVDYFPVGIVLNLRPRINEEGSEITMQVETIVSAVNQAASPQRAEVFFAPTVDNRQVQTFVRVADDTPFIIGGLISTDKQDRIEGVPILSEIPIVGELFRRKSKEFVKREVIVVLTPHVVPLQEQSFGYVIPRDSEIFDSFGHRLFHNAYRVRSDDVFDLGFVYESEVFQNLLARLRERSETQPGLRSTEPFASLLKGAVPGEEILVRRMLWEIVRKTEYGKRISMDHIIFFEDRPTDPAGFRVTRLQEKWPALNKSQNTLVLTFDAQRKGTEEHPFAQPRAAVRYEHLAPESYEERLIRGNRRGADGRPDQWTILLTETSASSTPPLERLRSVLVLKRILALNSDLPLTIRDFRVGRQILFPSEQDLQQSSHVIDRKVAQFFYEVAQYYPTFEEEFNRQTRRIGEMLEKFNR